jgi:hypothetical protein
MAKANAGVSPLRCAPVEMTLLWAGLVGGGGERFDPGVEPGFDQRRSTWAKRCR